MKTTEVIEVIASFGVSVPMEGKPHSYITDEASVVVPDTPYYRRRLADGDLELHDQEQAATGNKKPAARAASVKSTGE